MGSLMRVSVTSRSDISNAVQEVAWYSHTASRSHFNAVCMALKYVKFTRLMGSTSYKGEILDFKVSAASN